ncbi:MAG: hypothetical protein KDK70_03615 [Myxococcales bacterium]|nr:hypothetical protein [Myxococcales bacterium]
MLLRVTNLGPIREAELDLAKPLIVLVGPNNSGKTYLAWVAYSLGRMSEEGVVAPPGLRAWAGRLLRAEQQTLSLASLLEHRDEVMRAVAEALGTAARCGVHLTRRDLDVVARRSGLPRGFGGRRDTLEALLRAAAEYGVMPRLIAQLDALLAARDDGYAALAQEPGLAEHVPGWRRRLAATRGLLARLSDAALVVREHAVAP